MSKAFSDDYGFGEHKPIAIALLKQITTMLDEFEVDYCLISGTLLGYARHNDFIPWDDDIDLLVDQKIIEKIPKIKTGYEDLNLIHKQDHKMLKACFVNQGIPVFKHSSMAKWWQKLSKNTYLWPFADLFTYETRNENIIFFKVEWRADKFFPTIKTDFLGMQVNVPADPDYFLRRNYGNEYMTVFRSSSYSHKNECPIAMNKRKIRKKPI